MALSSWIDLYPAAAGTATSAATPWGGGQAMLAVTGTFGGATVALELLGPDGTTWLAIPGVSLTAPGVAVVSLPPCQIRAAVSGGPPSGLRASLSRVLV